MADSSDERSPGPTNALTVLERLDDLAHGVVAVLLLLIAISALIYTGLVFVRQLPLLWAFPQGMPHATSEELNPFFASCLELLSNLLFVAIILELLRTVLTDMKKHDLRATLQEFLLVGVISLIREILMVGAETSVNGRNGGEFVHEAVGMLIIVGAASLLVLCLVLLHRFYAPKTA